MEYKLKAYTIWDCGKRVDTEGKPHQEDSIYPAHQKTTDNDRLFILCDGMGGHEAGEVASATVCEAMSKSIFAAVPDAEGVFTDENLTQAIADAYDALDAKDDGTATKKMGTTMTLLKLHSKGCTIAHIGDSRVYHIRPGKTAKDTTILFRTEDHSLVNELVKAGELTPEEAMHSRQKNVITRAMQPLLEHRPKADVYHTTDIRPGDYFYLCSDGMLENMEDHQLCYYFSSEAGDDKNKVISLLKATQENSDNHSAIIVHITDVLNPIKEAPADFKATSTPLMGEIHEGNARPSANNKSTTPKKKKAKGLVGLGLFLLLCLIVAATIVFYPKPTSTHKTESKEQCEEEKDKPISKPIISIPPPASARVKDDIGTSPTQTPKSVITHAKVEKAVSDTTTYKPAPQTDEQTEESQIESGAPTEQEKSNPAMDVVTKQFKEDKEKQEETTSEETNSEPA